MSTWNTTDVVEKLKNLGFMVPVILPPGGDVDTESIIIDFGDDETLFIGGFTTEESGINSTGKIHGRECDNVEYVFLTDGGDDRAGLSSKSEILADAYIKIRQMLIEEFSFSITYGMDGYF